MCEEEKKRWMKIFLKDIRVAWDANQEGVPLLQFMKCYNLTRYEAAGLLKELVDKKLVETTYARISGSVPKRVWFVAGKPYEGITKAAEPQDDSNSECEFLGLGESIQTIKRSYKGGFTVSQLAEESAIGEKKCLQLIKAMLHKDFIRVIPGSPKKYNTTNHFNAWYSKARMSIVGIALNYLITMPLIGNDR
jgi:hypothetical protein